MRITWHGDNVKKAVDHAVTAAMDETLDKAADQARSSHPGWSDDTGAASRGIHGEHAKAHGKETVGELVGDEPYTIFLEIGANGHPGDHTLRRAGDREFPHLTERIRGKLRMTR
jgi:hypothetical protein